MTTTGCRIQWQVFIEDRYGALVRADYLAADNANIDYSFMHHKGAVTLSAESRGRFLDGQHHWHGPDQ